MNTTKMLPKGDVNEWIQILIGNKCPPIIFEDAPQHPEGTNALKLGREPMPRKNFFEWIALNFSKEPLRPPGGTNASVLFGSLL